MIGTSNYNYSVHFLQCHSYYCSPHTHKDYKKKKNRLVAIYISESNNSQMIHILVIIK